MAQALWFRLSRYPSVGIRLFSHSSFVTMVNIEEDPSTESVAATAQDKALNEEEKDLKCVDPVLYSRFKVEMPRRLLQSGSFDVPTYESLGIRVSPEDKALRIKTIYQTGLVPLWNLNNAKNPEIQIVQGDLIVDVNGLNTDVAQMMKQIKAEEDVTLFIQRTQQSVIPEPVEINTRETEEPVGINTKETEEPVEIKTRETEEPQTYEKATKEDTTTVKVLNPVEFEGLPSSDANDESVKYKELRYIKLDSGECNATVKKSCQCCVYLGV